MAGIKCFLGVSVYLPGSRREYLYDQVRCSYYIFLGDDIEPFFGNEKDIGLYHVGHGEHYIKGSKENLTEIILNNVIIKYQKNVTNGSLVFSKWCGSHIEFSPDNLVLVAIIRQCLIIIVCNQLADRIGHVKHLVSFYL